MNDLITKIQSELPGFSKGQKQIARFILEHYDKAAFMTASRLGVTVGVSESTVVRFATELGYDGYPHLQRALQEMIRNKLTSVQRMEVAGDRMGGRDVLQTVLHADTDMIRVTLDEIDRDAFQGAVDALMGAKRIYILGVRSSSALARPRRLRSSSRITSTLSLTTCAWFPRRAATCLNRSAASTRAICSSASASRATPSAR